jgi:hypothetical protein
MEQEHRRPLAERGALRRLPRTGVGSGQRLSARPLPRGIAMIRTGVITAAAVGILGLAASAQAAPVETGWVQFELRKDAGHTYVYPRVSAGAPSRLFSGNCQFNALVVPGSADPRLYSMLMTAKEQSLRVSLWYDDTDGPMCQVAHLHIEWAD